MADDTEPRKKRRVDQDMADAADAEDLQVKRSAFLSSLTRSVTPPARKTAITENVDIASGRSKGEAQAPIKSQTRESSFTKTIPSPFHLTHIRDLPPEHNIDAITIKDILGDPMIKECWHFNFLFDIDWLMDQFDEDTKSLVQVKIVHGSWKREAPNRIGIEDACQRLTNVKAITAYLPDPFGTHHSKMMVLFRHDDLAQVVIHTANMIPQDWTNMCQAVWMSPLLPLVQSGTDTGRSVVDKKAQIGTGWRFKDDILSYFNAYRDKFGNFKLKSLVEQIEHYDFSEIRAAIVASVPSRIDLRSTGTDELLWGWPALRRVLRSVPIHETRRRENRHQSQQIQETSQNTINSQPHIIMQISSIATLGASDKYLKETIFSTLSVTAPSLSPLPRKISRSNRPDPKFSVIFPTAAEIRDSLDGYASGSSIHMKIQSAAQQKQLQYLRPYLCHWSQQAVHTKNHPNGKSSSSKSVFSTRHVVQCSSQKDALRSVAAPHIKTYIRFHNASNLESGIDWAMVTSANLSTQAWGSAASSGEVRVQSYEIGVVIWPDLFAPPPDDVGGGSEEEESTNGSSPGTIEQNEKKRGRERVTMVPVFGKDTPDPYLAPEASADEPGRKLSDYEEHDGGNISKTALESTATTMVGLRMPYPFPLDPYRANEVPWCATMNHHEPDRWGRSYGGFEEQ